LSCFVRVTCPGVPATSVPVTDLERLHQNVLLGFPPKPVHHRCSSGVFRTFGPSRGIPPTTLQTFADETSVFPQAFSARGTPPHQLAQALFFNANTEQSNPLHRNLGKNTEDEITLMPRSLREAIREHQQRPMQSIPFMGQDFDAIAGQTVSSIFRNNAQKSEGKKGVWRAMQNRPFLIPAGAPCLRRAATRGGSRMGNRSR